MWVTRHHDAKGGILRHHHTKGGIIREHWLSGASGATTLASKMRVNPLKGRDHKGTVGSLSRFSLHFVPNIQLVSNQTTKALGNDVREQLSSG